MRHAFRFYGTRWPSDDQDSVFYRHFRYQSTKLEGMETEPLIRIELALRNGASHHNTLCIMSSNDWTHKDISTVYLHSVVVKS